MPQTDSPGIAVPVYRLVSINEIDMLIAAKKIRPFAQVVQCANRITLGIAFLGKIRTVCIAHTALCDQRSVAKFVLTAHVPDIAIAAGTGFAQGGVGMVGVTSGQIEIDVPTEIGDDERVALEALAAARTGPSPRAHLEV